MRARQHPQITIGHIVPSKLLQRVVVGSAVVAVLGSGALTSWWGLQPVDTDGVAERLCTLAEQAPEDPTAVGARFMIDAHEPLHVVAGELLDVDRARAARLFEAKYRVEHAISSETTGRDLAQRLAELAELVEEDGRCVGS